MKEIKEEMKNLKNQSVYQRLQYIYKTMLSSCLRCWKNVSSLGIKTVLSKISLVGPALFQEYEMNEIVNKFLLAEDKSMPEMHLRQPAPLGKSGFTCCACGPFTKKQRKNIKM